MKWLGPVLVVAVALLLELSLGRAQSAPELALFLGRFHPLVVHLPIGFFLLVAMAEGATFIPRVRDRVEPALGLLVPISALAALAAFGMGQLLALEGGFPAEALNWHRRLTLLAVFGMSACWVLYDRQRARDGSGRLAYRGALVATLGLLSLGAHFGGTMTRGESYLSKYAPGPLKPLLGTPEPEVTAKAPTSAAGPVAEPLLFADVVLPILNNYCFECHGTEKQKGKLRIDSLALLKAGGETGTALVPGDSAKSLLVSRMLLPVTDDDHMPPEGKPGSKPEELALVRFWIDRGATETLRVRDLLAPVESRSLLERKLGGNIPTSAPSVPASPSAPSPSAAPTAAPAESAPAAATRTDEPAAPSAPAATAKSAEPPVVEPAAAAPATKGVSSGPAFLATYCEKCHGGAKQKGKLRVDSLAALIKGGAGGTSLVPGKPEQSSLIQRLRLPLDNDEHMPPPKEPQPSAAEIATLTAWIRSASAGSIAAAPPASPSLPSPPPNAAAPSASAPTAEEPSASPLAPRPAEPATATATEPAPAAQPPVSFSAVQSVLRDKCGKCHIREKPAGGLGVEQHAQLLEGGYSGAGIVPRDRKASVVMQRLVLPASDDEHMPPEDEPALTAAEIELVGAWIDQGAPATGASATPSASSGPEPLAAKSGGCAACSVPGAQPSRWLAIQAAALVASVALIGLRRRHRPSRASSPHA